MKNTLTPHRFISYDAIRVVATILVVVIHTVSGLFFCTPRNSIDYFLANTLDGLSRCAVPLFVMLSGALFLNEDKVRTVKQMLVRSLKMYSILVFWLVFYGLFDYLLLPVVTNQPFSLDTFIGGVFLGRGHLWYLFMIVGIYTITPIIRLLTQREHKALVEYFLLISIAILFVAPIIAFFYEKLFPGWTIVLLHLQKLDFPLDEFVTYYILGWYLVTFRPEARLRKTLYVFGILGAIFTIGCTQFFETEEFFFYGYETINVLLVSAAAFVALNGIAEIKNQKVNRIITCLSSHTFGVYLIHMAVLSVVQLYAINITNPVVYIGVTLGITLTVSFLLSFLLSKTPILRRLVRS